jgi:glycosyltransferase involved in cell wall biosynthesis
MFNVSIVIPAYNEEKYIGRLLASLKSLSHEKIIEILIIDNGSQDKTKEIVKIMSLGLDDFDKKIRLIEESRKGVAWARTRGAQEAKGEIIAFLDADTEVTKDWLIKLFKYFTKSEVVCVSGPTYYYDVSPVGRFFAAIYWWFVSAVVSKITGYAGIFANLAVRAESYRKIGGIDTSVEFYGDDTNLTRRLSKVGKVIFPYNYFIYASARRFNNEGFLMTTFRYAINFVSEVFIHKPVTKGYTEIR